MKKINWAQNDLSETPEPSSGPLLKSCHTRVTGGSETQSVFTELHSFCGRANCFLVSLTACVCVCVKSWCEILLLYSAADACASWATPGSRNQVSKFNNKLPTTENHTYARRWKRVDFLSCKKKKLSLKSTKEKTERVTVAPCASSFSGF